MSHEALLTECLNEAAKSVENLRWNLYQSDEFGWGIEVHGLISTRYGIFPNEKCEKLLEDMDVFYESIVKAIVTDRIKKLFSFPAF